MAEQFFSIFVHIIFIVGLILFSISLDENDMRWPRNVALILSISPQIFAISALLIYSIPTKYDLSKLLYVSLLTIVCIWCFYYAQRKGIFKKLQKKLLWSSLKITKKHYFLISILPFVLAIFIETFRQRIDHDILVYLLDAKNIANTVLGSNSVIQVSDNGVLHPHSDLYSILFSIGYIFGPNSNLNSPISVLFFIGLTRIAILASIFYITLELSGKKNFFVLFIIILAVLLFDDSWAYQLDAAAIDVFYTAPFLIILTILVKSKPNKIQYFGGFVASISTLGVLMAHSLGVLYLAPVVWVVGIVKIMKYRFECSKIFELMTATLLCLFFGLKKIEQYWSNKPADIGFTFPYYSYDKALYDSWISSKFMTEASLGEFIKFLYLENFFQVLVLILIAASVLFLVSKNLLDFKGNKIAHDSNFFFIAIIFLVLNFIVIFFPIRFEELVLRSAFISNVRYGFLLRVLLIISSCYFMLAISQKVLENFDQNLNRKIVLVARYVLFSVVLLGGVSFFVDAYRKLQPVNNYITNLSEACSSVTSENIELFYVGNDAFKYRCPKNSKYIFSEGGKEIMLRKTFEEMEFELLNQNVGGFVFSKGIYNSMWVDTRLGMFLEKNWQKTVPNSDFIFFKRKNNPE